MNEFEILTCGLVIIVFLISSVLVTSYLTYLKAFRSHRKKQKAVQLPESERYDAGDEKARRLINEIKAIPYEGVAIESRDGLRLVGRYYHVKDGAPLHIEFHGYRGAALRDFSGGNKLAREMGHNTLLVDQRAHGDSEGNTIMFGVGERYDCLLWIKYAVERFGEDTPIFLAGISMGAATVLMASELNLPKNVKGIIADCPYSSPKAIIKKEIKNMHLPPTLAFPFVMTGAAIFGNFKITDGGPVEAVKKTDIPILLIHGEDDGYVPCSMSREIYAACTSKKRLELFPGAKHGMSYLVDTERYERVVHEFISDCLNSSKVTIKK